MLSRHVKGGAIEAKAAPERHYWEPGSAQLPTEGVNAHARLTGAG